MENGKLNLVIGPMYSGKTSSLIHISKKYDLGKIWVHAISCTFHLLNYQIGHDQHHGFYNAAALIRGEKLHHKNCA